MVAPLCFTVLTWRMGQAQLYNTHNVIILQARQTLIVLHSCIAVLTWRMGQAQLYINTYNYNSTGASNPYRSTFRHCSFDVENGAGTAAKITLIHACVTVQACPPLIVLRLCFAILTWSGKKWGRPEQESTAQLYN